MTRYLFDLSLMRITPEALEFIVLKLEKNPYSKIMTTA